MTAGTVGESVGAYRLVRPLGRGGMGEVWLAEHAQIGSRVAIKLVLGDPDDAEVSARFLREARATARVRHPNIVAVSDYGERPGGGAYLVMELLDGETLAQRMQRARVALPIALEIAVQIADALGAAHEAGVVHRDLKPTNVFLVDDPAARHGVKVKLLDFGVAKSTTRATDELGLTATGALVGTPLYMAPEQCASRLGSVDHRTDLYALGVVLYQLVTGAPPFSGPSLGDLVDQHVNAMPAPPRASTPAVPPKLEALILTLLAKRQDDRPASAAAVARALRELGVSRDETAVVAVDASTLASGVRHRPVTGEEATAVPRDGGERVTGDDATVSARAANLAGPPPAVRGEQAMAVAAGTNGSGTGEEATVSARDAMAAVSIRGPTAHARRRWWPYAAGAAVIAGVAVAVVLARRDPPSLDLATLDAAGLARACRDNHGGACFALATREHRGAAPVLSRVFAGYRDACDLGVADGCARLAWMYGWGAGVQPDDPRARELAERACTAGSGMGCELAGDFAARGIGGPLDIELASKHLGRGCDLGHPDACQAAGRILYHGIGNTRDVAAGRTLQQRALELGARRCDAGDPEGCRIAGLAHIRDVVGKPDPARGATLLERACELGSPEACGDVGQLYALGIGVAKNPELAGRYLALGCRRGYTETCGAHAVAVANGMAGAADHHRAFTIARDACSRTDRSCLMLGNFYAIGIGVARDVEVALVYYERACTAGDPSACAAAADAPVPGGERDRQRIEALLARACELGSPEGCKDLGEEQRAREDFAAALASFERACRISEGEVGCVSLSALYFAGQGVPADPARGRALLEDGCKRQKMTSCHALGVRVRDGRGVLERPAEALEFFEKACNLSWAESCHAVAELLSNPAYGLAQDPQRAAAFHARGCELAPASKHCKAHSSESRSESAPQ